MSADATADRIRRRLVERLAPVRLDVVDDSARHAGHAGAAGGGGHFIVTVVADAFAGVPRVERHRMVYEALTGMMGGEIHALGLRTLAPDDEPAG